MFGALHFLQEHEFAPCESPDPQAPRWHRIAQDRKAQI